MGLRIIRPPSPPSPSEVQCRAMMEEGARRWSVALGEDSEERRAEYRRKFQLLKSRKVNEQTIGDMARGVEERLKNDQSGAAGMCGKVDIATLLELL